MTVLSGNKSWRRSGAENRCRSRVRAYALGPHSTIDLIGTLQAMQAWGVSVIVASGLTFDLSTPHGKLIASVLASLAEFERDLP
jgi:DNA invertase Pin-like site-specific DNA recombinase